MIKFNIEGIVDEKELGFNLKLIKTTIKKILRVITKKEKIRGKHYISYLIINNEEIHRINKEYRHIDHATDVISFAMVDNEDFGEEYKGKYPVELGDIFISYEKAIEQAVTYGHSNLREMAFLITHGTLHLLGYDHLNENEAKIMFSLQEEILNKVKITRNEEQNGD